MQVSQQQANAIYTLPWSGTPNDERRFRIIVVVTLVLAVALSAIISAIDVPKLEREEVEKIPPRLAKMILEKKKLPPPPPPKPPELEKPPEPEKPKPEEKKPEPKKPEPKKPEPKVEKPKPKPDEIAKAREKASTAGVLAMRDMLADLRESQPVEAITAKQGLQKGGDTEAKRNRSILTAKTNRGSGGIDTSKFSRDTAGTDLGTRETVAVEDFIENMPEEVAAASTQGLEPGQLPGRPESEITKKILAAKASIDTLYQRELRRNPLLQGKIIFKIVIEPDGTVSDCEVVSSELNHKRLERKLVLKIKQINFGAKDVAQTAITFPMDFFPNM